MRFVNSRAMSTFSSDWHDPEIQVSGALHVGGEYVADCTDRRTAERIHQIRDALMRVEDPVGGGVGWCNLQTAVVGAWPELGLDEASSFI